MRAVKLLTILLGCLFFINCNKCPGYTPPPPVRYYYVYTSDRITNDYNKNGNSYGMPQEVVKPGNIVADYMVNHGYREVHTIGSDVIDNTLVVKYDECSQPNANGGYTSTITIRLVSAKTNCVVYKTTATCSDSTYNYSLRCATYEAISKLF